MLSDDQFFRIAGIVAESGTCSRLQVGALVVRDNRIISVGYNGAAAGLPHCQHDDDTPCRRAVHAEVNALVYAARAGVPTLGATVFSTHAPCEVCAGTMINAGISAVKYQHHYRDMSGVKRLMEAGVAVSPRLVIV